MLSAQVRSTVVTLAPLVDVALPCKHGVQGLCDRAHRSRPPGELAPLGDLGTGARSRLCDSASTVVQPRQDVDDGPTTDSGLWAGLVRFGAHDDFDEPNCQHERAPQTSTLASGQFRRLRACSTRWPLAPGSSCVGARLTGTLTQGGRPGRESGHRLRFGAVCVATPRGVRHAVHLLGREARAAPSMWCDVQVRRPTLRSHSPREGASGRVGRTDRRCPWLLRSP